MVDVSFRTATKAELDRIRREAAATLARLREDRGWKPGEVARRAGIAHTTYLEYEGGGFPDVVKGGRIASVFGVEPREIWPCALPDSDGAEDPDDDVEVAP